MNSILHFDVSLGRTGFAHNELSLFHLAQIGSTKGTFSDCQPPCLSPIVCAPLCKPHAKNYTRERRGSHLAKSFSHSAFVAHRGDGPKSSTLQLYAKLQNVGLVRFSLRNSIQQGTCQNFDLWMQELTTRLGVSGILCCPTRTPASFQPDVFGRTEMQTDLETSRQISIISEQTTLLTNADVCRPSADRGIATRQTEKFTSVPDMRTKPRYIPRRPRHTAESKPALCGYR